MTIDIGYAMHWMMGARGRVEEIEPFRYSAPINCPDTQICKNWLETSQPFCHRQNELIATSVDLRARSASPAIEVQVRLCFNDPSI
ncbi:hypothetical protein, partial [Caballeronia humi]|uniref:hypothetical protein n=1 Tax=Caballeronia humi TaxID=326474 RepID=UPI001F2CEAE4